MPRSRLNRARSLSQAHIAVRFASRIDPEVMAQTAPDHDLERIGTLHRCRRCRETHRASYDFTAMCRPAA